MTDKNRMQEEMIGAARDLLRLGLMDDATHEKITRRHLGSAAITTVAPIPAMKSGRFGKMRTSARPFLRST